jgi:hypothetical protein
MLVLRPTNLPTYGYVSTYLVIKNALLFYFIFQILINMPCHNFLLGHMS